jgi:tRNA A-37 threonylcarbamoyl transferase component Bud32
MKPAVGDLISGKYRLVRLIGEGGMGSVFEARHEYLGTNVALKFIHPEITRRPELVARFLQEARLSASIKSLHIARVTDVDQAADGAAYLVMELLEGKSLHQILDESGRLSQDVALDYTVQILAGLAAAHKAGVVHRDLKPDNVFVLQSPHGPVLKLLDFGIAKLKRPDDAEKGGLTRPGMMMGTPEYMAPEQAFSADTVDARADIYSVGTMLYEMLSGQRPTPGNDPQQIAAMVLGRQVPYLRSVAPTVPDTIAQITHRAMAPAPTDRWGSAEQLRDALTPFCGALSVAGRLAATPAPSAAALPPPDPAQGVSPQPGGTQAQPAWTAASNATVPQAVYPATLATVGAVAPASVALGAMPVPPAVRPRSPRGFSFVLFALLAVVAVGIVVFAVVTLQDDGSGARTTADAPTSATVTAEPDSGAAALATAPAAAIRTVAIAPPAQPAATTAQRPAANVKHAAHADAGPATDGGSNSPAPPSFPLPFPLPSALPTALPTAFPSSFPINLPGFFPPPAPSK